MKPTLCTTLVLIAISAYAPQTHAMYFLLNEGQHQCFLEEMPDDIPAAISYKLETEAKNIGIIVEILGPDDSHMATTTGLDGKISFTSGMGGDHSICFHTNTSKWFGAETNLKVHFSISVNEEAINYDEIARADHLDSIEVSIRRLQDKIRGIRHEQEYMKSREVSFHEIGESTQNRVYYFTVVQVAILVVTGLLQTRHIKSYLKGQKAI